MVKSPTEYRYHLLVLALVTVCHCTHVHARGSSDCGDWATLYTPPPPGMEPPCTVTLSLCYSGYTAHHTHPHTTLSSLHPKHKCNALIYLPQSMRGVGDTFFTNQNKVNHRIWNFKYHLQTTPFIKKSKYSWYLGNINI